MAPIRIGIVGLSSKPGAWATLAHLPRLIASPNYEIVALCNSTLESTKAAIAAHNLPETTKAYDSYDDLAADPDVDLYVVSTRADSHSEGTLPAIRNGKNVFVEWPLAATTEAAREMAELAKEKGVKTMIGFQGRMSPSVRKVKELVDTGALGEIHSVNYYGAVNNWHEDVADERYSHFMNRSVGANLLTIYGGHVLDSILYAIGELKLGSYVPMAVNLRPRMRVKRVNGCISEEWHDKDTPDQILLQGQFDREPPAVLSFHLRAGSKSIGSPGSTWRIFGTKGELVVEFSSAGPQMAKATSMRLSDFETKQVEEIVIYEGGSTWENLPFQGQNIGRLYEAYAAGEDVGDFDLALRRHQLLDEFWDSMR
jgi:predicted dehydrogenase